jgi:hypothetical protein
MYVSANGLRGKETWLVERSSSEARETALGEIWRPNFLEINLFDTSDLSECQNSGKWAGGLMPYVVG